MSYTAAWLLGFGVVLVTLACEGACLAAIWRLFFAPLFNLPIISWPLATAFLGTLDLLLTRQCFVRLNRAHTGYLPVTHHLSSAVAAILFAALACFMHAHMRALPTIWNTSGHIGVHAHNVLSRTIRTANSWL